MDNICETHWGTEPVNKEKKIVPYNTGKVLIGCNYYPQTNYYNDDQDWVQEVLLGIERSRLEDNLFIAVVYALAVYVVLGLLTRSWYES